MKKICTILLAIFIILISAACSKPPASNPPVSGDKPNEQKTPAGPQQKKEYPYADLKAEDIEKIQVFTAVSQSPAIEDEEVFKTIAEYIRNAKFIKDKSNEGAGGNCGWGMTINLNKELDGVKSISVCYTNGEGKELVIGPQGYEYLIESQQLGDFIMSHLNNGYSVMKPEGVPQEVMSWFSSFGNQEGAYVYQHPDITYIKINAGEKPTGGYDLQVKSISGDEYSKKIVVELIEPQKGDIVTQVLTYPSVILRIDSDNIAQYVIEDTKGNTMPTKSKVFNAAFEVPEENQKITNPVSVKGRVAAFEGSFVIRILDTDKKILKEQILQTNGAPEWGSFDAKITYSVPSTAQGSIEIGEFSAKDGEYIRHAKVDVSF